MNFSEKEWAIEKRRLQEVLQQIDKDLQQVEKLRLNKQTEVNETRTWMWEEVTKQTTKFDAVVDIVQHGLELERQDKIHSLYQEKYNSLLKMKETPYFGRFDFIEEGEKEKEKLYIGIHTLENESGEIIVYDWRAPISSMYYDFQLGEAYYKVENENSSHTYHGEITLKRQYKIKDGQLQYMFDSAVQIGDEFLQELLRQKTDEKMKSIVTSIQKEQNQVIRDKEHKVVIVQGVAGSGKTSIALQRVAFLLYAYRKSLTAENILIFSPNEIFNDYISSVLPELGEQNTLQTTFQSFVQRYLDVPMVIESKYDQMEYLLAKDNKQSRLKAIQYKSSLPFMRLLKAYIDYLQREGLLFKDICYQDKVIVSKEEMNRCFFEEYKSMSFENRLEKVKDHIKDELAKLQQEQQRRVLQRLKKSDKYLGSDDELKHMSKAYVKKKLKGLRSELNSWSFDLAYRSYLQLFEKPDSIYNFLNKDDIPAEWEEICTFTLQACKNGDLFFEDVSPLLYFKFIFEGNPTQSSIYHLVIDEYQDYPAIFYEIMKKIFPRSKFTILGDINQSINPYASIHNVEAVTHIFGGNSTSYILKKSYRSTREITQFSKEILSLEDTEIDSVSREGNKPELIKTVSVEDKIEKVLKHVEMLQKNRMNSIAIICKNMLESETVYSLLKEKLELHYLSVDQQVFKQGILLLPSYLSKGLEFDAVIVWDAGKEVYQKEEERKLLYTICTRALHSLSIYYQGEISPLINCIKPTYYHHEI